MMRLRAGQLVGSAEQLAHVGETARDLAVVRHVAGGSGRQVSLICCGRLRRGQPPAVGALPARRRRRCRRCWSRRRAPSMSAINVSVRELPDARVDLVVAGCELGVAASAGGTVSESLGDHLPVRLVVVASARARCSIVGRISASSTQVPTRLACGNRICSTSDRAAGCPPPVSAHRRRSPRRPDRRSPAQVMSMFGL